MGLPILHSIGRAVHRSYLSTTYGLGCLHSIADQEFMIHLRNLLVDRSIDYCKTGRSFTRFPDGGFDGRAKSDHNIQVFPVDDFRKTTCDKLPGVSSNFDIDQFPSRATKVFKCVTRYLPLDCTCLEVCAVKLEPFLAAHHRARAFK